jgi:DnaJ-domain-containing protein 1
MPLGDAYKLLKVTAGSTWELIEQTRRQLVQRSYPDRLGSMSAEGRAQVLAESKRVNAAYTLLSQARCGGR